MFICQIGSKFFIFALVCSHAVVRTEPVAAITGTRIKSSPRPPTKRQRSDGQAKASAKPKLPRKTLMQVRAPPSLMWPRGAKVQVFWNGSWRPSAVLNRSMNALDEDRHSYSVRMMDSHMVVDGVLAKYLRPPADVGGSDLCRGPAQSTRAQHQSRSQRHLAPATQDSLKVFLTHFHLSSHWDDETDGGTSVYHGMNAQEVECAVAEFDRCYNQDYSGSVGWFLQRGSADASCKAFVSNFKHRSETERVPLLSSHDSSPDIDAGSARSVQAKDYVYARVSPFCTSMESESGWKKCWAFKIDPFDDERLLTIHVTIRTWVSTRYVCP